MLFRSVVVVRPVTRREPQRPQPWQQQQDQPQGEEEEEQGVVGGDASAEGADEEVEGQPVDEEEAGDDDAHWDEHGEGGLDPWEQGFGESGEADVAEEEEEGGVRVPDVLPKEFTVRYEVILHALEWLHERNVSVLLLLLLQLGVNPCLS